MAKVFVRKGEALQDALGRFERQVKRDGILADYRRGTYFKTESEKRTEKSRRAARKRQKRNRDN